MATLVKQGSPPRGSLERSAPPAQLQPSCWLTDTMGLRLPASKSDFAHVGALMKRRGGFGKMAQNPWKARCFVLMKEGLLCYFDEDTFAKVDFRQPPRGVIDVAGGFVDTLALSTKPETDSPTAHVLVLQVRNERWKLCAHSEEEMLHWLKVLGEARDLGALNKNNSVLRATMPAGGIRRARTAAGPDSISSAGGGHPRRFSDGEEACEEGFRAYNPATTTSNRSNSSALVRPHDRPHSMGIPKQAQSPAADLTGATLAFLLAATVINASCYALHTLDLGSSPFFLLMLLLNVVLAHGVFVGRAAASASATSGSLNVPLVHGPDVRVIALGLKRLLRAHDRAEREQLGAAAPTKPVAGSTMRKWEGPRDSQTLEGNEDATHTWCSGKGEFFSVRGPAYMTDRQKTKVTSADPLYELVGVDFFGTDARAGHIAKELDMQALAQDLPSVQGSKVPPFLVMNVQLPSLPPSFPKGPTDGPGVQVVYYYRITSETANMVNGLEEPSAAVRLWMTYIEKATIDPAFKGRFKVIAVVDNMDRLALPGGVTRYNGKPVLINKSGEIHAGPSYWECDINVHNFGYPAKKGLSMLSHMFKQMVLHVGFLVEGRENDTELPETLLAAAQLNFPDLDVAADLDV